MSSRTWRFVFLAVFTAAIAGLLLARQSALERLRREAELSRPAPGALAALRRANAELKAARTPENELDSLRADHATVAIMRNEIAAVQRSLDARDRSAGASAGTPAIATLLDRALTPQEWRNAGSATPAAAVETALWAAAGGNADKLAETLLLTREAREKAEALLAGLPPDLRREYTTAERLIGGLSAKEIPSQSAQVVAEVPYPEGAMLVLNLLNNDGRSRRVSLRLRPDGSNWRIEVPATAVDRFVAKARASSSSLEVPPLKVN